tara:strand:+ start:2605 stop:2817 length:213 start_codon:yes stop_codon:yes gene_type:complete
MAEDLISLVSLESAGAVLLLILAYKVYKMKLDTETESNCCKWLKIKTRSHNPGGEGNPFTSVLENKTSEV